MSAAQLPRKTGTLNLAQWGWAGWELQCANVHRGVGEERGAGSAGGLLITLLDPMATQACTTSRTGQAQRAGTPGQGLRIWQGKGEELPSHPTSWPWRAVGSGCKGQKGNPSPGRKHRAATLLSCSRDPQWHSSSDERCLTPSKWRSCQPAHPWLWQPRRVHCPLRGSCPHQQRCLLCLAGVEAPRASKALAGGAAAGSTDHNTLPTHRQHSER